VLDQLLATEHARHCGQRMIRATANTNSTVPSGSTT
jgi:hypothetical protein